LSYAANGSSGEESSEEICLNDTEQFVSMNRSGFTRMTRAGVAV